MLGISHAWECPPGEINQRPPPSQFEGRLEGDRVDGISYGATARLAQTLRFFQRIVRQADIGHSGGPGVVCRRDEDVGRKHAGRRLDALAHAPRGGLADEDDVVGDEQERRAAIEKIVQIVAVLKPVTMPHDAVLIQHSGAQRLRASSE